MNTTPQPPSPEREDTHDAKWAVGKRSDVPPWADKPSPEQLAQELLALLDSKIPVINRRAFAELTAIIRKSQEADYFNGCVVRLKEERDTLKRENETLKLWIEKSNTAQYAMEIEAERDSFREKAEALDWLGNHWCYVMWSSLDNPTMRQLQPTTDGTLLSAIKSAKHYDKKT
jgi:hypothetical protein